jgi:hypothetical protein
MPTSTKKPKAAPKKKTGGMDAGFGSLVPPGQYMIGPADHLAGGGKKKGAAKKTKKTSGKK